MLLPVALLLAAAPPAPAAALPPLPAARHADTLRLEVGSPEVDGRIYRPHAARVRVRVGAPDGPLRAEWTNALSLGDSAGRPVMRWITRGTRTEADGARVTWEIHQTYDARTLAPYGYLAASSTGACTRLAIDGRRVRGTKRAAGADAAPTPVDLEIDRAGFIASASDLVPLAAGLRDGVVMTAPVWGPAMTAAESRTFAVVGRGPVDVEGTAVEAWKVEERKADGAFVAAWYLTEASPYMVYGEVALPDGRTQYMSEVEIPMPADAPAPDACAG